MKNTMNMDSFRYFHTERYLKAAKELSSYVKTLPLSVGQNNRLIRLMLNQVTEAETEAFTRGVELGRELG